MPALLKVFQFLVYNSSVPASVAIGKGSFFAYKGIGVVIHARVKIGSDCTIGQGITIGGRSKKENVPVIGNRVYLGAGCRVLGDIVIGNNVIIGPNAVVIDNVPSNCIVVGVPARIVKREIKYDDFI
ncbi:serine O-acetyltransferase [Winogradskyella sp.]